VRFDSYKNKDGGGYNTDDLAIKTLEEIPKQFLEYMQAHKIEPMKSAKTTSRTASQDMVMKMKGRSKASRQEASKRIPPFLYKKREEFFQRLVSLEFDPDLVESILNEGLPAPDINLFMERLSTRINQPLSDMRIPSLEANMASIRFGEPKKNVVKSRTFKVGQKRELESVKSKVKEENYRIMQKMLEQKDNEEIERRGNMVFLVLSLEETVGPLFTIKKRVNYEEMDNPERIFRQKEALEQKDVNEFYKELTTNNAPVSNDNEICLICRANLINIVRLVEIENDF
jgi:hypothetical protein